MALVLSVIATSVQTVRMIKNQSSVGIAYFPLVCLLLMSFCFGIYGSINDNSPVFYTGVFLMLESFILIITKKKYDSD